MKTWGNPEVMGRSQYIQFLDERYRVKKYQALGHQWIGFKRHTGLGYYLRSEE